MKYIDADEVLTQKKPLEFNSPFEHGKVYGWNEAIEYVGNFAPTADVVEVVRCGECKHLMADGRCFEFADDNIRPSASDYCSYGERRKE